MLDDDGVQESSKRSLESLLERKCFSWPRRRRWALAHQRSLASADVRCRGRTNRYGVTGTSEETAAPGVCEAAAVSGGAAAALIRTDVPKGGGGRLRGKTPRRRGPEAGEEDAAPWPEEERSHAVRPQCRRVTAGASGTNYERVSGDVSEVFSVHITAEGIVQKTRDPDQSRTPRAARGGLTYDELNRL
ncbi:hypothetical protein EYF80_040475 [Liparis tanakae]|uniref:Uncharacterized protein n=1 Tax=Liparis tanakae TaxID=230148 RepID=A0A4Z2G835_9TELE|nr:hypothetical protein EYF80_040475 [Liparis tanakae]